MKFQNIFSKYFFLFKKYSKIDESVFKHMQAFRKNKTSIKLCTCVTEPKSNLKNQQY